MRYARGLCFAALLVAATSTGSALAQPSQSAAGRAAQLFEQGRAAMRQRDFAVACKAFHESQRLDPSPGTLLNLALCGEQLGNIATALDHYRRVAAQLPASDERAAFASKQAAALETRVPRLTIKFAADTPPEASVALDGVGLARDELGRPRPVDPGKHVVEVRAPGRAERRFSTNVEEGKSTEIDVSPGPEQRSLDDGASRSNVGLGPETSAPPDGSGSSMRGVRLAGLVIGGVGVAGLVVGGVTGAMVLDRKSTVDELCTERFCTTPEGIEAASEGATLSTISTVTFIAGLTALGAGVTLFFVGGDATAGKSAVVLRSRASGAVLSIERAF